MAQTQVEERFGSSNDLFDNAITTDIQRSKFDLSRKNLFTADVGMIIPIDIIASSQRTAAAIYHSGSVGKCAYTDAHRSDNTSGAQTPWRCQLHWQVGQAESI